MPSKQILPQRDPERREEEDSCRNIVIHHFCLLFFPSEKSSQGCLEWLKKSNQAVLRESPYLCICLNPVCAMSERRHQEVLGHADSSSGQSCSSTDKIRHLTHFIAVGKQHSKKKKLTQNKQINQSLLSPEIVERLAYLEELWRRHPRRRS